MASVYSTSFIRSHGGAGGSYTVPDGYLAVIRCVTGFSAADFSPEIGQVVLGHSSCTVWYNEFNPVSSGPYAFYRTDDLRVVVEAGDTINVTNGTDVDVTVSGYLLTVDS